MRIFGRDQGEAEDQPAGILKYIEDLSRWLNTDIGRKDFFEMVSGVRVTSYQLTPYLPNVLFVREFYDPVKSLLQAIRDQWETRRFNA